MRIITLLCILLFTLFSCISRDTSSSQLTFSLSCAKENVGTVKELLDSKQVDVNAVNGRVGPCLVSAAYGGHKEIIKLLLEHGADINVRDENGGTPLVNAVIGNQVEIVELLLKRGADPNIIIPDKDGKLTDITALKIAKTKGNRQIITLLEERQ